MVDWLDFAPYGMRLDVAEGAGGARLLVLRGAERHAEAARAAGFAPDAEGRWIRPGVSLGGSLLRLFPDVRFVAAEVRDVTFPLDATFDPAAAAALREGRGQHEAAAERRRDVRAAGRGFDRAAFRAWLGRVGHLPEYRELYVEALLALHAVHGPGLDAAVRGAAGPRHVEDDFVARGGGATAARRMMMEYAAVAYRAWPGGVPDGAAAPDGRALRAFLEEVRRLHAPMAARRSEPESCRANLNKAVKLFGVPFLLDAARDPAAARRRIFEGPETAHLSRSTRNHTWNAVALLGGRAAAAVERAWDNAFGAAPEPPAGADAADAPGPR